ncbi:MAG: hypothetical protein ACE5IZ_08575, partial [Dehalococcoidia bacterium]
MDWGERERAEELWQEVDELASRTHDPWVVLYAVRTEGLLAMVDGRLEDAVSAGARLAARGDELGMPDTGRINAAMQTVRPLFHL